MNKLLFTTLLFWSFQTTAQVDSSYTRLLQSTAEIKLTDSVYINSGVWQPGQLDTMSVKKWFLPLVGYGNNRLKNRAYFLAGKITSNPNFDLLVFLEDKKRADSSMIEVVYLVSYKKEGKYIASLEVAVSGNRKKSSYYTSSWLFNDFSIIKDSKITVNDKSLANDLALYKINSGGRFILYPYEH